VEERDERSSLSLSLSFSRGKERAGYGEWSYREGLFPSFLLSLLSHGRDSTTSKMSKSFFLLLKVFQEHKKYTLATKIK
jgi:hypothetical protein